MSQPGSLDAWELLQSNAPQENLRLVPLGVRVDEGDVAAAIDGDGNFHLLLPIPSGTRISPDHRSAGVHIDDRELIASGRRVRYVDVVCLNSSLNDVFKRLANDICALVAVEPGTATTAPPRVLNRWRALLDSGRERMAVEAEAGLVGELFLLRRMISLDPARRVDHWRGPDRAVHDFNRGNIALEVKTTTARDGRSVRIHGLDQLDSAAGVDLFLVFLRLSTGDPDGQTLTELVAEVDGLVSDQPEYRRLLDRAGWRDDVAESGTLWSIVESRCHAVDAAFPRLAPTLLPGKKVPDGVTRISYTLNLDAVGTDPLAATAYSELLEKVSTA